MPEDARRYGQSMAVLLKSRGDAGRSSQAADREIAQTGRRSAGGPEGGESGEVTRREWRWCLGAAAVVMALTCLPYLWLWRMTPPGLQFLGFPVGPDDQCVYLAWMRQAADGHFFLRSLWTNDPQRGLN